MSFYLHPLLLWFTWVKHPTKTLAIKTFNGECAERPSWNGMYFYSWWTPNPKPSPYPSLRQWKSWSQKCQTVGDMFFAPRIHPYNPGEVIPSRPRCFLSNRLADLVLLPECPRRSCVSDRNATWRRVFQICLSQSDFADTDSPTKRCLKKTRQDKSKNLKVRPVPTRVFSKSGFEAIGVWASFGYCSNIYIYRYICNMWYCNNVDKIPVHDICVSMQGQDTSDVIKTAKLQSFLQRYVKIV